MCFLRPQRLPLPHSDVAFAAPNRRALAHWRHSRLHCGLGVVGEEGCTSGWVSAVKQLKYGIRHKFLFGFFFVIKPCVQLSEVGPDHLLPLQAEGVLEPKPFLP